MLRELVAVGTAVFGVAYLFYFCRFWHKEAQRLVSESGYAPPIPRLWARALTAGVARLAAVFFIGKVKIRGGETALRDQKKYRYVAVFNHQLPIDAIVVSRLAKLRRWRFMVAMEEVRRPLLGPFYAIVGAIPVIRRDSEAAKETDAPTRAAAAAVIGAVNALKADSEAGPKQKGIYGTLCLIALALLTGALHLLWLAIPLAVLGALGILDLFVGRPTHFAIFPQGKLVLDDDLQEDDFHGGPIKIARRLQKSTGQPVALLPAHIRYNYDAATASTWVRFLSAIHFPRKFFGYGPVYGATLTVGEPIPVDALEKNDNDAARRVYREIVALKAGEKR